MIELLTNIGAVISVTITLIGLSCAFLIRFQWRCGMCGKLNETGILRFIFAMCKHDGDFN